MDDVLEVISIGRITDIETGSLIYQIQFGKLFELNDVQREAIPPQMGLPARQQSTILLVLNVGFKGAAPYRVGSKWVLHISESGAMTLKEVKK